MKPSDDGTGGFDLGGDQPGPAPLPAPAPAPPGAVDPATLPPAPTTTTPNQVANVTGNATEAEGDGTATAPEVVNPGPATVPTVDPATLGPAPGAAAPPPPGRPAAVTIGAPAVENPAAVAALSATSPAVDAGQQADLARQIQPILRDGLADALNVGRETLEAGAAYYAPLIAKQAILEASADPATRERAAAHSRHLKAQFLMRAAENGIALEQRQEQRALGVLTMAVRVGIHFLTGATA